MFGYNEVNLLPLMYVLLSSGERVDASAVAVRNNFQPLVVNGSMYCANDTPSAVVAVREIVGIPDGVPDAVRCGYVCTGYVNCTSFNCKSGIISSSGSYSSDRPEWDIVCELYNYIPENCTTSDATESNCIHYQVARKHSSCLPYVCDVNCAGSCDVQGPGKCDAQCRPGLYLTSNYTCDCPYGFSTVGSQNSCYKLITQTQKMPVASTTCRDLTRGSNDSHLVYVNNAAEMNDIATYLSSLSEMSQGSVCNAANNARTSVSIGACRVSHIGNPQFLWANQCSQQGLPPSAVSQPMIYTNWANGEPNDNSYVSSTGSGGEYCAMIVLRTDGSATWGDVTCDRVMCSLCELEMPTE